MAYQCISIEQARELMQSQDATIFDIRDAQSFAQGHMENAINVSDQNVTQVIDASDKTKPLLVVCYHGNSSKGAADYFSQQGFAHSYSVDGGYELWKLQKNKNG